jgi:hypothetical protein
VSTTITQDRRIWLIGAAVVLAAAVIVALQVADSDPSPDATRTQEGPQQSIPATPPPIKQAKWEFSFERAGGAGKLSKKAKRRLHTQRPRIAATVRSIYGGLLETERHARPARLFTRPAWHALKKSGAGIGRRAESVKSLKRRASVGIQAGTAKRATAKVKVVARGLLDDERFRMVQRSILWMERTHNRWQVIAFELDQKPLTRGKGGK